VREPEFPALRLRRLRRSPALRALTQETRLAPGQLLYPLFVREGRAVREPIPSMPGQSRLSVDELVAEARELAELGVAGVLLFGLPAAKDATGSGAWVTDGIVQRAARALKDAGSPLLVVADVCLCEYTDHGHCGVLEGGEVANDPTLELLARAAVSLAEAGVDVVAPSAMMDGQVAAIRRGLDEAGRTETPIVAYAAKYASAFYGPFREAADSAPRSGDRRGYQMDPPNAREALREMAADLAEGADVLMVKPALPYLDVLRRARERFAMIVAAAERGWIDRRAVALESLTAIARAGADVVITYFAKEAASWLR